MKLVVLQENLKTAVALTSHFTSPKAQLPILGNILLRADKTKLTLSSTNLEISVKTSIAAKIEEEGEIGAGLVRLGCQVPDTRSLGDLHEEIAASTIGA